MQRVRNISGQSPIIIVAPHGYEGDDERTALISEEIANKLNAFAVINLGWERCNKVDFMQDKADCNNVIHCLEDVVREEFLEPIVRYKSKILAKHSMVNIFYIHGMSNKHRKISNDPKLDIVVGYGAGHPNSFSCEDWKKNLFIYLLERNGINAYEGASGGYMSGWNKNNMNQLFRKWYYERNVQSMQIEIIHELRKTNGAAKYTAGLLAELIDETVKAKSFSQVIYCKSY